MSTYNQIRTLVEIIVGTDKVPLHPAVAEEIHRAGLRCPKACYDSLLCMAIWGAADGSLGKEAQQWANDNGVEL